MRMTGTDVSRSSLDIMLLMLMNSNVFHHYLSLTTMCVHSILGDKAANSKVLIFLGDPLHQSKHILKYVSRLLSHDQYRTIMWHTNTKCSQKIFSTGLKLVAANTI